MGKQKKIPKIPSQFKKILKGKGRGKGEGLTITVGLTKGQGLAKTDPNISLKGITKYIPKGKKVRKTIIKTASQGTKITNNKKESNMSYKQTNQPAKSIAEAKRRGLKTFMGMDKSGMRTKKLAAVSREDMEKAGFKSFGQQSLRKYLNMRNKLGRQPKSSDFQTQIGAEVKKSQNKAIRNKQKENRKKDISSANKPNVNDPSYNVKKLKVTPPPKGGTSTYNKGPNPNDPSYNTKKMGGPRRITTTSRYNRKPNVNRASYNRGGFVKIGDGDKIVRRAYGGKVGK